MTNKRHGFGETIQIRHLPILDTPVYLRIRIVRYECLSCDDHPTTSEQYDWCDRKSKTTKALDLYINRNLIHSTIEDVSRKEKISSELVESALNRIVNVGVDWSLYSDLETIGIDEIALKKGHNDYMTIISARDKLGELSVITVLPDRLKETIKINYVNVLATSSVLGCNFLPSLTNIFCKDSLTEDGKEVLMIVWRLLSSAVKD